MLCSCWTWATQVWNWCWQSYQQSSELLVTIYLHSSPLCIVKTSELKCSTVVLLHWPSPSPSSDSCGLHDHWSVLELWHSYPSFWGYVSTGMGIGPSLTCIHVQQIHLHWPLHTIHAQTHIHSCSPNHQLLYSYVCNYKWAKSGQWENKAKCCYPLATISFWCEMWPHHLLSKSQPHDV